MVQIGFIITSVIFIALGIAFLVAELAEEGIEFFGPAAIFCLIVGTAFFFLSEPTTWLIPVEWFEIFTVTIISILVTLTVLSVIITYKFIAIKRMPSKVLKFIGEIGQVIERISAKKDGFIRFHGELWKASSDEIIEPGEKVRIIKKEGLTLTVKPLE